MIKVYLDNNIFRLLEKEENSEFYNFLLSTINRDIIVLYSKAHINDLHQDKSDKKHENLEFMDKIVEDNFLVHDEGDIISNYLIRPKEAYQQYAPSFESNEEFFSSIFKELNEYEETDKIIAPLLNLIGNVKIDLGFKNAVSGELKDTVDKLGFDTAPKSISEWVIHFGKMLDRLQTDQSIIKNVRLQSKKSLKVEKFKIDINSVDFDKSIAETPLGMSFTKLLENSFENISKQEKKNLKYTKFVLAFSMLNFLGLDKEKNKKVKYSNTFHDSEHFFYSTLSDWVVSEDNGFRNKARFLSNLFGMELIVMDYKEFQFRLKQEYLDRIFTAEDLMKKILFEIKHGIVVDSNLSVSMLQKITITKLNSRILNFFNRVSHSSLTDGSNKSYVILYMDGRRVYQFNWLKDFKSVTNKLVKLFGNDSYGYGYFSNDDWQAIQNNEWYGREWKLGNTNLVLGKNMETGRLNLIFGPYNQ